ncbi:DUF305 domain-containing protein [Nonomuraea sp. NPDC050310]|uniref:DUF305 domain-containing protein n=1 Tax=unclassified Nonomuraea TaxID=2593643 RepID=UPI0034094397
MRRLTVAVLLLPALLGGCGTAQPAAEPVNADDVMFLQMMIPHHRQGLEIVKLARDRGKHPELKTLAAAIETTQGDEIANMSAWLHDWDQPLAAPTDAHAGHDVPETDLRQITALRKSKTFDRDFLLLLIAHQDDAVQLALKEGYGGANPKVKAWAKQVEKSRLQQIQIMKGLLEQMS